jgi:hypothetical protein
VELASDVLPTLKKRTSIRRKPALGAVRVGEPYVLLLPDGVEAKGAGTRIDLDSAHEWAYSPGEELLGLDGTRFLYGECFQRDPGVSDHGPDSIPQGQVLDSDCKGVVGLVEIHKRDTRKRHELARNPISPIIQLLEVKPSRLEDDG